MRGFASSEADRKTGEFLYSTRLFFSGASAVSLSMRGPRVADTLRDDRGSVTLGVAARRDFHCP